MIKYLSKLGNFDNFFMSISFVPTVGLLKNVLQIYLFLQLNLELELDWYSKKIAMEIGNIPCRNSK